jgi:hypothetical protein
MARFFRWERRRVGVSLSPSSSISTSSSEVGTTAVLCPGALAVKEAVERVEAVEGTVDVAETVEGRVNGAVEVEVLRMEVDDDAGADAGAGAGAVNMSGGCHEWDKMHTRTHFTRTLIGIHYWNALLKWWQPPPIILCDLPVMQPQVAKLICASLRLTEFLNVPETDSLQIELRHVFTHIFPLLLNVLNNRMQP